ncbi:16S rRNA (guanine(966)-N(2))-methyltransferase RsmD [Candidatus Dojkabacteria bacterium]|nr:16S rRNA (guanine(966)-N(2))-methyltransferase RsmD [Candidatus Dojkabacteria bacterium]
MSNRKSCKSTNPRIITGSARGQRLEVPGRDTRPMTDRVKSALFSIINPIIIGVNVLDLYAGTGALGIECISRGAKKAVFVDKSRDAIECIHKNLAKTGFEALAEVVKGSVSRFLDEFSTFNLETQVYDIIFFTPPHNDYKEKILDGTAKLLSKKGILIAEHPSSRKTSDRVGDLEKIDERKYGITSLSFYRLST